MNIFFTQRSWIKKHLSDFCIGSVLVAIALVHIFFLVASFWIDEKGNILTTFAGNGDVALRMTQISNFAFGNIFSLQEPIFIGEPLTYHFLLNFISGLLLRLTDSWVFAFQAPILMLALANIGLLFLVYQKILKGKILALFGVLIFLFGSGFGAFGTIKDKIFEEGMNLSQFFSYMAANRISFITQLTNQYPEQNIAWGAPFGLVFLHQHPFLLGLFLFLIVLFILLKTGGLFKKRHILLLGILLGLAPLSHIHSFIAIGVMLGFFAAVALIAKDFTRFKNYAFILLLGGAIALPQLAYLAHFFNGVFESSVQSFLHFRLGWMTEPGYGSVVYPPFPTAFGKFFTYLNYTWMNFGIILPAFLLSLIALLVRYSPISSRPQFRQSQLVFIFALAGLSLFFIVQTIQFQPWDYDNNKILVYFQFFAIIPIVFLFGRIASKWKVWGWGALAAFLVFSIHGAILDLVPRIMQIQDKPPVLFTANAFNTAEFIKHNVPRKAVILTGSSHVNPVASLAGKPVLVGYPGWLWTRGIPYQNRLNDIMLFYQNPAQQKHILTEYNVSYIMLDPSVRYDWGVQRDLFDNNFKLIYENPDYILYALW